ncbi:MAG: alanine--tRNA ligase, partial [bacterium]|nr:alanine--tRNA ligase [bacterium]
TDLAVTMASKSKQEALDSGAIAFFVEKYPDQVTVYTISEEDKTEKGWISKELCGGPHVKRTSEIGEIRIQKEQAVSAGVRRIYMQLK